MKISISKIICMTVGHKLVTVEHTVIPLKNGDHFPDTATKICTCCGKIVEHRVPMNDVQEHFDENN